jgi:nicotinamidase-related amidase
MARDIRIDPERTALLVIDMQNAFLHPEGILHMPTAEAMIPRLQSVVDDCREAKIRVVWVRLSHEFMGTTIYGELWPDHFDEAGTPKLRRGSFDFEIHRDLKVLPEELIVDKFKYTAFTGTNLETILRQYQCDTVIIVGLATNACCESTARDAFFRDFRVIMVSDANATLNDEMQKAALDNISMLFGYVLTSTELREALGVTEVSSTPSVERQ